MTTATPMPRPAARLRGRFTGMALLALLGACGMTLNSARAETTAGETWTLVASQPLLPGRASALPWPLGTHWVLGGGALRGPQPLACEQAHQRLLRLPPQGLFQGAWQAEAAQSAAAQAAALGLHADAIATLRLDCANSSIDFHRRPDGRLLAALDGQVLVLSRGEPAARDAQAAVRQLLLQQLAGDEVFGADSIAALRPWLAPALRQAFARWLARQDRTDDVPALDGDPFSDTQEPPLALRLGALRQRGDRAEQQVFAELDGGRSHRLIYQLTRRHGRWQLKDIVYAHGPTLLQLLRAEAR